MQTYIRTFTSLTHTYHIQVFIFLKNDIYEKHSKRIPALCEGFPLDDLRPGLGSLGDRELVAGGGKGGEVEGNMVENSGLLNEEKRKWNIFMWVV